MFPKLWVATPRGFMTDSAKGCESGPRTWENANLASLQWLRWEQSTGRSSTLGRNWELRCSHSALLLRNFVLTYELTLAIRNKNSCWHASLFLQWFLAQVIHTNYINCQLTFQHQFCVLLSEIEMRVPSQEAGGGGHKNANKRWTNQAGMFLRHQPCACFTGGDFSKLPCFPRAPNLFKIYLFCGLWWHRASLWF